MKSPLDSRRQITDNLQKENDLLVEILAFCLMPNHFHLLLKQISEKGIINFMGNVQNSYVKYLNIKEGRIGPLFQSAFKGKRIETDEQLLHVSRYIHLNPSTSYLVEQEKFAEYPWSSLPIYISNSSTYNTFVNPRLILEFFKSGEKYREFLDDQAGYQQELANIKHLTME
ncbi:MAG: transposase [bacterium]|nr:transposase [bacterium]